MPSEIIKLLFILLLVMFFLKLKLNLGLNLLLNSLFMSFLFRIDPLQILILWKDVISNPEMLQLLAIIFLVYVLSIILERLKKFEGMVYSLQTMIRDYRLVMILISSFVALLPIQGGAIFSAPMIKSIGKFNHVSSEKNMFINYWFRHIWLFMWPLYPDIILYASLLGMSLKKLILTLLPFAVIAFLSGTIWVYRNLKKTPSVSKQSDIKYFAVLREFIRNTWPVLVVIVLSLFFSVALLMSLFLVIMALLLIHPEIRNCFFALFAESIKTSHKTLLVVFGVFIFKEILEYTQVVEFLPEFFLSAGIPLYGILFLVPFLVGFFTGSAIAYVGICVPVFLSFLVDAEGVIYMSRVILLYIAGYIGMMSTPIHLCLAITKDYFQIKAGDFYSILLLHLSVLLMAAMFYYLIMINLVS